MKKTIVSKIVLFVAMLFLAMKMNAQTNDELKAQIMAINKDMAQAMVNGNTQKSLSYYTADAISMPNNMQMVEGIDAIKKSDEDMMQSGMKVQSFETNTLKVMSSGNMITEIGTYKISMTAPNATDPINDHGKYVTIWEKQPDGSLKIKLEIWNTDVNPMANN
jgi:ketosteroid isomerase-like protein